MKENAEQKIREYIRRKILSMEYVSDDRIEMVKMIQEELAKKDLHFPNQLVADILEEVSPILYTDKKDLYAKVRHFFLDECVENSRASYIWRNFSSNNESLEGWARDVARHLAHEGCTYAIAKKALQKIELEYPYYMRVFLREIYAYAIFEIGVNGHFTINSVLMKLQERGLGYIDRPEEALFALNKLMNGQYIINGKNYVVDWGRIECYPSNSHLWPDTHGFFIREAKDGYDRGFQN